MIGMPRWWPRLRVEARIALGLTTLFVGAVLVLDLLFGLSADPQRNQWELRRSVSENLATTVAQLMQARPGQLPVDAVGDIASRQPQVRAVALHDRGGRWLPLYGDPATEWQVKEGERARLDEFRIPILQNGAPYGSLHVGFTRDTTPQLVALAREPFTRAVAGLAVLGWVMTYLYLRRVLQQLDPQQAIPRRVRAAFDVLDEGVLMLDLQQRVMMVNEAFVRLLPADQSVQLGQPVTQFGVLTRAVAQSGVEAPWQQAQRTRQPSREVSLRLDVGKAPDGQPRDPREVIAKATPVLDAFGRARGTMVSLGDVTALQRLNRELRASMDDLAASRDELHSRNQELLRLATRDPMTGCLNRRSFFDLAQRAFDLAQRRGEPLGCVMADIDHFKRINDSHGHQTGDAVIVAVARELGNTLRETDMLCRYGGEEFCLLLPGLTLAESAAVAERLRERIELLAGPAANQASGSPIVRVTASLGVAEMMPGLHTLPQLIERADMALYVGKRSGRNRVSTWSDQALLEQP
jgi:diguanylate cyclase (GGDEF)-like protein